MFRLRKHHIQVKVVEDKDAPEQMVDTMGHPIRNRHETATDIALIARYIAVYGATAYTVVRTTDTILRMAEHIVVKRVA